MHHLKGAISNIELAIKENWF